MRSFHFAVQTESSLWVVTFVSEYFLETRILTSAEFIEMISAEAELGPWP